MKKNWKKGARPGLQPEPKIKEGYLLRYSQLVTSGATGAVFKDRF